MKQWLHNSTIHTKQIKPEKNRTIMNALTNTNYSPLYFSDNNYCLTLFLCPPTTLEVDPLGRASKTTE